MSANAVMYVGICGYRHSACGSVGEVRNRLTVSTSAELVSGIWSQSRDAVCPDSCWRLRYAPMLLYS